jgi:GTPase
MGKIYYATQVAIQPPTIVIFVNDPALFNDSYRHYLGNALRDRLPYAEIPLRIEFKTHTGERQGRG